MGGGEMEIAPPDDRINTFGDPDFDHASTLHDRPPALPDDWRLAGAVFQELDGVRASMPGGFGPPIRQPLDEDRAAARFDVAAAGDEAAALRYRQRFTTLDRIWRTFESDAYIEAIRRQSERSRR